METTTERRASQVVWLVVALAVGFSIFVRYEPNTFLRRDASFYATITRGLATDFSLDQRRWQPQTWYNGENPRYSDMDLAWSNVSVGKDGTWYPKHSFVMSLFAVPFYWAMGSFGLLLFNALGVFFMLVAAYHLARRMASPLAALSAVLLIAAGPVLREHSYHFSLDVFSAALVAGGFWALAGKRSVAAGLLLGIALWARPTLLPLVVPLGLVLAWRFLDRRQLAFLIGSAAVPLALAALSNTLMFGAPWTTAYHRVLTVVKGQHVIASHTTCFSNSWGDGLQRLLLSDDNGWLYKCPCAFLGLAGLPFLWRRDRAWALGLAAAVVGFVMLFAPYKYATARFFLPGDVLLVLPLALLLSNAAHGMSAVPARLAVPHGRRLLLVAGALTLAVLAVAAIKLMGRGRYVLSDHVAEAKVFRNELACDYFNMGLGRWECSKVEDDNWEYTGLALSPDACLFKDQKGPRIWFHPPRGAATKRLIFDHVPGDEVLLLSYGLADSASSKEVCFTAQRGTGPKEELCADEAGQLLTRRLLPSPDRSQRLELTVTAPPRDRRHLCLDGESMP